MGLKFGPLYVPELKSIATDKKAAEHAEAVDIWLLGLRERFMVEMVESQIFRKPGST